MSDTKRKKSRLSLQDKLEIIKGLEKGETGASLAKSFNVHAATICDIKRRKSEIMNVAKTLDSGGSNVEKKILKKDHNMEINDAVFAWFTDMRKQRKSVTGRAMCQKALELNKKLGGPPGFKASSAWLRNFKDSHNIKFTGIYKEAFTYDAPKPKGFREQILKMVEEEGFCMDDIYGADECRLCLKSVLRESLTVHLGMRGVTFEIDEPVTSMLCVNATGQHSLPLYVVTKFPDAHNFLSDSTIPIKYKVQKNAWMDYSSFMDWFSHHFIPLVSSYRAGEGLTGKVLLLVDNSASHSPLEEINKINSNFIVRYLPSGVEPPSNQGMKQAMQTVYVNNLQTLMSSREENFMEYLNDLTIRDCCSILAMSWNGLPSSTLKKAWQRFWKALEEAVEREESPQKKAASEDESKPSDQEYEEEWLEEDDKKSTNSNHNSNSGNDSCSELLLNQYEYEKTGNVPSHAEALIAFQTAIRWCEEQSELNPDEITLLQWMKDLAERKMQSSI